MTDYSNPKVMKAVMNEAKSAGIFDKTKITSKYVYSLLLNSSDAMTLDMIKDNKDYKCNVMGYKIHQVNYAGGSSSLIRNLEKCEIISGKWFFGWHYKIIVTNKEQKRDRAWSEVFGRPVCFIFKNKSGFIEIIKPIWAKMNIK
jgi:hypothetical protein